MPADLPNLNYPVAGVYSFTNPQPTFLTISCGTGNVSISLNDGKVTLTNCPADDGAKAFWNAVEQFAPMKKQ